MKPQKYTISIHPKRWKRTQETIIKCFKEYLILIPTFDATSRRDFKNTRNTVEDQNRILCTYRASTYLPLSIKDKGRKGQQASIKIGPASISIEGSESTSLTEEEAWNILCGLPTVLFFPTWRWHLTSEMTTGIKNKK